MLASISQRHVGRTSRQFLALTVYSLIVKSEIHAWILSVGWDYPRSYTNQLGRLSGGQQRRVAIARAIAQSPKIILADEFLSELDEKTLEMVKTEVVEFVRNESSTLIVVEHDVSRAKSIADRMLVIDDGRVNPFISRTTALEVKK